MVIDAATYRNFILQHYQNPQNYGTMKHPDLSVKYLNESCGDEILLQLKLDAKKNIKDVRFSGSGCAVSIASSSLFTESLKGKKVSELSKIKEKDVLMSLGFPIGKAREKCALVPLLAVQVIIKQTE